MRNLFLFIILSALAAVSATAQEPFRLVSSEARAITAAELADRERSQTRGSVSGETITFTQKQLTLVVTTGPADDALSYRIQGVRNPTLAVPAGATISVLFVNTDHNMRHDVRFGHRVQPFDLAPGIEQTAGSDRLAAHGETGYQAAEMVLEAVAAGEHIYYCSVRGHARRGMWGRIAVGVEPGAAMMDHSGHAGDGAQPTPTPTPDAHAGHGTPRPTPTPDMHAGHGTPMPSPAPDAHAGHGTPAQPSSGHTGHGEGAGGHRMSSSVDIGDTTNREGSGTSWLPDSSPLHAYMKMYDDGGMLMLMGTGFLRYTQIGGSRDVSVAGKGGRSRVSAPTMFMAMYARPLTNRSQLGLRVMASLDPIIERGWGYPLLYQSGELYRDEPIHDRQHPHDFISELAATYSYKVNETQSFFVYGGVVGEPALGPPMFMHRPSASNNPDAPIGHHWQDASHITWGVVTGGYNFGKFKVEGSVFNGTEPDENRWAFDKLKLDSYSARFSVMPTRDLTLQVSHGYLKKPERAEPDLDHMRRTTASAIYNKAFDDERNWASTFVWGQNHKEGKSTNAFLFESDYSFGKNAVFGRVERVQKDGHELVIPHEDPIHDSVFWVGAYSIGYVRDIYKDRGLDIGIGGMATFNSNPAALTPYYGGTRHGGWQIFMRFRPSKLGF